MTRNQARLLLLGLAAAVSIAVAAVATRQASRTEEARAEARLVEFRAGLEADVAQPHPLQPGVVPQPCRSGERLAAALAELPPLTEADRAHLADFLDAPTPATSQGAWPVLLARVPVLQEGLDSAACRDLTPLPDPAPLDAFAEAVEVTGAQVQALAWAGDVGGALRWALDLCSVGRDLQAAGAVAEHDAGLAAIERMLDEISPLLLDERLPADAAARGADAIAHLLDRAVPIAAGLDRERRHGHRVLLGARDPEPTRALARIAAYDRSLDALRQALQAPAVEQEGLLRAWAEGTDPSVSDVVPIPLRIGEIGRRSDHTDARARGLLLVAALRAWPGPGCPRDTDALREGLSKETGARELVGAGIGYDDDACEVIAVDSGGVVLERWQLP